MNDIVSIQHFGTVVPGVLYRGAAPSFEALKDLKAGGIKTVVDLREEVTTERDQCIVFDLQYWSIPCEPLQVLDADIADFLLLVTHGKWNQSIFVHCTFGRDRTGIMIAAYRMVVQDWTPSAAVDEFVKWQGDFHRAWYPELAERVLKINVEDFKSRLRG